MENETIVFKDQIDLNILVSAYSRILGIDQCEIVFRNVLSTTTGNDYQKVLFVEYFRFEEGDFKLELTPLISKRTRANNYEQNLNLYRNLAKIVNCDLLIPGNYFDLAESYSIILKPNGQSRNVYTKQPKQYDKQGVNILKEK